MTNPPAIAADRKTRRRFLVLVCMVCALVTLGALAVLLKPRIERELYLRNLQREPQLVELWIVDPGLLPAQEAALVRFLGSRQGKEALFELYLSEYDRRMTKGMTIRRVLDRVTPAYCDYGLMTLSEKGYSYSLMKGIRQISTLATANRPEDPERRRAVLKRLGVLSGERFHSELFPRFEFELVAVENGRADEPSWRLVNGRVDRKNRMVNPRADYVCYFKLKAALPEPTS